jgi:methylmalonyl-CoA mutase cobalamin-binding domain/chain
MLKSIVTAYNEAIEDIDQDRALEVVQAAIDEGASPEEIIFELVIPAIEQLTSVAAVVPEASLAQNFLMARIGSKVTGEMLRKMRTPPPAAGCVILGTAPGDLHSLGKTIVGGCLRSMTFEVVDLGIDVPPERFVEEAVARNAQVIGVSAMMAHTALGENGCLGVRRILKERGLEGRIKIVVGGAIYRYNPSLCQEAQADSWAPDGMAAGKVIGELIKGLKR